MRMPFQRLMEEVARIEDRDVTMGDLSKRFGEPPERIMDAIDANRILEGEQTYIGVDDE